MVFNTLRVLFEVGASLTAGSVELIRKQLIQGQVLFFRYAPPLTKLDFAVRERDRPAKPHPNAEPFERSVFYFWWAYLRANEAYLECCANGGTGKLARLYEDFGDVRDDDFMAWWKSGKRELFCEPPKGEIEIYDEPPATHDSRNRILLSLPITGDLELSLKELRAKLGKVYAKERQKMRNAARARGDDADREKGASLARYPVHTRPNLHKLYNYLRVMQIKEAKPDAEAHEIAEEAGILNSIGGWQDEPWLVKRRVMEYEHKAANLIANVAEGRFPDQSPHPDAKDAKGNLINAKAEADTAEVSETQLDLLSGERDSAQPA